MKSKLHQRTIGQIIIWLAIFTGIPLLFIGDSIPEYVQYRFQVTAIGIIFFIPLNLYFFFPKFYENTQPKKYILFNFLTIAIISLLFSAFYPPIERTEAMLPFFVKKYPNAISFFRIMSLSFPLILVWLSSTLYEISILSNQNAKVTAQLKSEKLEAELKFLKSQINPHFLFNSLNNIYTLTVLEPKLAGESLLKLSEMLRYLLYECDADKVPLSRELTYLKNYIALFSLKDEEALNINLDAQDIDTSVMIAPLLLVPFIENAFKHSQIEDLENGWINATLFGDQTQVYFEIKNSLPQVAFAKDEVGGIGLQNVKRQLDLIYPDKHNLNITKENNIFSVELTIFL